jgi:hypothetical protein
LYQPRGILRVERSRSWCRHHLRSVRRFALTLRPSLTQSVQLRTEGERATFIYLRYCELHRPPVSSPKLTVSQRGRCWVRTSANAGELVSDPFRTRRSSDWEHCRQLPRADWVAVVLPGHGDPRWYQHARNGLPHGRDLLSVRFSFKYLPISNQEPLCRVLKKAFDTNGQQQLGTTSRLGALFRPNAEAREVIIRTFTRPPRMLVNPVCALFITYYAYVYSIIYVYLVSLFVVPSPRQSCADPLTFFFPQTAALCYSYSTTLNLLVQLASGNSRVVLHRPRFVPCLPRSQRSAPHFPLSSPRCRFPRCRRNSGQSSRPNLQVLLCTVSEQRSTGISSSDHSSPSSSLTSPSSCLLTPYRLYRRA